MRLEKLNPQNEARTRLRMARLASLALPSQLHYLEGDHCDFDKIVNEGR